MEHIPGWSEWNWGVAQKLAADFLKWAVPLIGGPVIAWLRSRQLRWATILLDALVGWVCLYILFYGLSTEAILSFSWWEYFVAFFSLAIFLFFDWKVGKLSSALPILPPEKVRTAPPPQVSDQESRERFIRFVDTHEKLKTTVSVGLTVKQGPVPPYSVLIIYAQEVDWKFTSALSRFFESSGYKSKIYPRQENVNIVGIRIDGPNASFVNMVRDFLRNVGLVGVESDVELPHMSLGSPGWEESQRAIKIIVGPAQ